MRAGGSCVVVDGSDVPDLAGATAAGLVFRAETGAEATAVAAEASDGCWSRTNSAPTSPTNKAAQEPATHPRDLTYRFFIPTPPARYQAMSARSQELRSFVKGRRNVC